MQSKGCNRNELLREQIFGSKGELETFYKEYNGEAVLNPFISCLDIKTFYPNKLFDPRFHTDYITPKKIRLFEKYESAPEHINLFVILTKHKEKNGFRRKKNNWK